MTESVTTAVEPVLTAAELELVADRLAGAGETLAGPLVERRITGGRSNITLVLDDGASRWVLRMPPRAGRTPSAHDVAREFRVTSALASTDVAVPRPVLLCDDESVLGGPFAVAEHVSGVTVQTRDDLDAVPSDVRGELPQVLVSTLAALHRVDYAAVGLGDFARPDAYAERQLRRWARQWEVVGDPALTALASDVESRLTATIPSQNGASIVHGDFRIDNTLLTLDGKPRVAAVVDWELSTLGDPVADVAMMCAYRHPAFDLVIGSPTAWTSPELPDSAALAGLYESAGGVELAHWGFHLALAYYKIAVIAAGIDHRFREAGSGEASHATSGQAVQPFLDAARHELGRTA
jgi:aminoglycoside phosphotransferase (APT) family kinase protein